MPAYVPSPKKGDHRDIHDDHDGLRDHDHGHGYDGRGPNGLNLHEILSISEHPHQNFHLKFQLHLRIFLRDDYNYDHGHGCDHGDYGFHGYHGYHGDHGDHGYHGHIILTPDRCVDNFRYHLLKGFVQDVVYDHAHHHDYVHGYIHLLHEKNHERIPVRLN